ncbi:MAG: AEC family transporter [Litorivicinaceae bacterium]
MNEVFNILAPVLALGLIGYFATRFGFFLSTHRDGLSKYVFDFAVPMLLFSAIVELEPPEASTADLFITYYVPLVAIFTLGMIASWLVLQRSVIEAMVIGLGSCFSNTVLLGIPLIPRALGDDALFPLFLLISVHGITVFTAVTVIIEIARGRDAGLANLPKQVANGLIGNPLIVGLGLGFLWKLTDLGIHPVAADVFHLVATSVTPAALFVLGSSLASYSISGSLAPAVLVTTLKNAIHPLAVFILGSLLGLEALWLSVATMLAAMPAGMNMYLFASRYHVSPPTATTSILISTISSIVTISIVIALLKIN